MVLTGAGSGVISETVYTQLMVLMRPFLNPSRKHTVRTSSHGGDTPGDPQSHSRGQRSFPGAFTGGNQPLSRHRGDRLPSSLGREGPALPCLRPHGWPAAQPGAG